MSRFSKFIADRRGNAIVEFALVTPVFIAIVIVLLEAGYYLWTLNVVDHTARETVRYGVVRGPWGDKWAGDEASAQAALNTFASGEISEGGLDPAKATTASVMDTAARTLTVSVTYQYSPMLVPSTLISSLTLSATSVLDIQRP